MCCRGLVRQPPRSVTAAAGRRELRRWLRDGPQIGRDRLAYIAQTFFLGELGDATESLRIVRGMQARWKEKLAYLEYTDRQVRAALHPDGGAGEGLDLDRVHRYAALRMGLLQLRAKLVWCEETIARLESWAETEPVDPAQTPPSSSTPSPD